MEKTVQIFKALGDETRLKILIILSRRTICAKGLARHLNISEAAVSQHIKVLKEVGIISGEKVGYYVQYNLQKSILMDISKFIHELSDESVASSYDFGLHIPNECMEICKSNVNKCCKRKNKNLKGEK